MMCGNRPWENVQLCWGTIFTKYRTSLLIATVRTSYLDFGLVTTVSEYCNNDSLRDHKIYIVYEMVFERQ